MFDIHTITLVNFRSYWGNHQFDFPVVYGLYYLTGENIAKPALGANGTGKSTLLDAITWVLFGRTTRGLKGNEVLSWGTTACQVTLSLTVGGQRFKVRRSQKPNGLFIDDKPVDQKELEKHIRLNYDSFKYSIINTQFGESFMALSPSAKLALFSDIMNLDFWLQKSEEADFLSRTVAGQIDGIKKAIIYNEGQLVIIDADIATYKEMKATFKNNLKVKIALKRKEIDRANDAAISLDEKIAEIASDNHKSLKRHEDIRDLHLESIIKTARERSECVGKLEALKEQQAECAALDTKCPVCHQIIDPKHLESRVFTLNRKSNNLTSTLRAIEDDLVMYKKFLVQANGSIDTIIADINETKDKKVEAKILNDKIVRLKAELKELNEMTNPWEHNLSHKLQQASSLGIAIARDTKSLDVAEADYVAVSYWIKGFKRIRLFIIEQAFRTLEIEVNNSLAQLGMSDWQITFDIERENKSGGITKGFVAFVKSPNNTEPVRWENWSGGETQRLQLAGDLGLANLITEQSGLVNTTEFFDEPSTHLSPEGMMDLANMLHDRAVTERKRIWIVDHAAISNFGEFQGIITVRKDENGSTIQYNQN